MKNIRLSALAMVLGVASVAAYAEPVTIQLPPDTSKLKPSTLPGYDIAVQKCNICHSSNYISYQPPGMSQKDWTAEMHKMHYSYGAPITDDQIKSLGAYLSVTYGSAKATDPSIIAASKAPAAAKTSGPIDVKALLAANSCLSCHGLKNKVVGPAYSDVAAKYKDNPNAVSLVVQSIKNGGSGRWGTTAMPPMSGLSDAQATALAKFVLQQ